MIMSLIFGYIWGYLILFAIIAAVAFYLLPPLLCIVGLLLGCAILFPIARKLDDWEAKKKAAAKQNVAPDMPKPAAAHYREYNDIPVVSDDFFDEVK